MLPKSTVRSLIESGTLEWDLEVGAGVGRQWSSSCGTHALDCTRSKRDMTDGIEGSISGSLVHLFPFIKPIS